MVYNPQLKFQKLEDIGEFKELSLDSMYNRLNDLKKKVIRLKTINPQTNTNKVLKKKF